MNIIGEQENLQKTKAYEKDKEFIFLLKSIQEFKKTNKEEFNIHELKKMFLNPTSNIYSYMGCLSKKGFFNKFSKDGLDTWKISFSSEAAGKYFDIFYNYIDPVELGEIKKVSKKTLKEKGFESLKKTNFVYELMEAAEGNYSYLEKANFDVHKLKYIVSCEYLRWKLRNESLHKEFDIETKMIRKIIPTPPKLIKALRDNNLWDKISESFENVINFVKAQNMCVEDLFLHYFEEEAFDGKNEKWRNIFLKILPDLRATVQWFKDAGRKGPVLFSKSEIIRITRSGRELKNPIEIYASGQINPPEVREDIEKGYYSLAWTSDKPFVTNGRISESVLAKIRDEETKEELSKEIK